MLSILLALLVPHIGDCFSLGTGTHVVIIDEGQHYYIIYRDQKVHEQVEAITKEDLIRELDKPEVKRCQL